MYSPYPIAKQGPTAMCQSCSCCSEQQSPAGWSWCWQAASDASVLTFLDGGSDIGQKNPPHKCFLPLNRLILISYRIHQIVPVIAQR